MPMRLVLACDASMCAQRLHTIQYSLCNMMQVTITPDYLRRFSKVGTGALSSLLNTVAEAVKATSSPVPGGYFQTVRKLKLPLVSLHVNE
jgi:spore coat protein U-like protein